MIRDDYEKGYSDGYTKGYRDKEEQLARMITNAQYARVQAEEKNVRLQWDLDTAYAQILELAEKVKEKVA